MSPRRVANCHRVARCSIHASTGRCSLPGLSTLAPSPERARASTAIPPTTTYSTPWVSSEAKMRSASRAGRQACFRAARPAASSFPAIRFQDAARARRSCGVRASVLDMCAGSQSVGRRRALRTGSSPIASISSRNVVYEGETKPRSMRLTAACVVPARRASCRWFKPSHRRVERISSAGSMTS